MDALAGILKAGNQGQQIPSGSTRFNEADAPEVLMSISEDLPACGECERCPGMFHREDAGDQQVFCVHSCHKVSQQPTGPVSVKLADAMVLTTPDPEGCQSWTTPTTAPHSLHVSSASLPVTATTMHPQQSA